MAHLLNKLRSGIPVYKIVNIKDTDVAIVVVSIDTTRRCEEIAQDYETKNKDKTNRTVRDNIFNRQLVFECLRDPNDLSKKIAENPEEIGEVFDAEEISRIVEIYSKMMINKVPKIEFISVEDITEIKNYLDVTPLNDLNTVSLVHLANFLQAIRS